MKKEERNKKIFEWSATILSIAGAILNAFLLKEGFYLWIVANSLWIVVGVKQKMWGLVLTYITFLAISFVGIIYWTR